MINTKTKGELGNRIEYDVEHDLFHPQNVYSDEYITPTFVEYVQKLEKENAELNERLQKKNNTTTVSDYPYSALKLEEAKKLLNEFMRISEACTEEFEPEYTELIRETENFLKEVEL